LIQKADKYKTPRTPVNDACPILAELMEFMWLSFVHNITGKTIESTGIIKVVVNISIDKSFFTSVDIYATVIKAKNMTMFLCILGM